MIEIHDKFGNRHLLRFEKKRNEISIYLGHGRKKHFVSVIDIHKDAKTAKIQEFILHEWPTNYRRLGLGTRIAALLEEKLRESGIRIVIGDVVERDKGAEVFWKKQGYEITPCNIGPVRFTIKKEISLVL